MSEEIQPRGVSRGREHSAESSHNGMAIHGMARWAIPTKVHVVSAVRSGGVRDPVTRKFYALAEQWKSECSHLSSIQWMVLQLGISDDCCGGGGRGSFPSERDGI